MFAIKFLCSAKGLWITCYFLPFSWEYLITILVAGKLPPGLVVNVEDSQSEPLSLDVGWIPAMRPIIGLFTTYTIAESPKRNFEFLSFFTKNDDDIDEDDFVRIDNSRYENSRYDFIKTVTSKYDVILSEDLDCDSPNDQSITIELPSQQQYHQHHHQHVNFSPEISPEPSPSPPQVSRFQQVESRFQFH